MNHDIAKLMWLVPSFMAISLRYSSYFHIFSFSSSILVVQRLKEKTTCRLQQINVLKKVMTHSMIFGFVHFYLEQNWFAKKQDWNH